MTATRKTGEPLRFVTAASLFDGHDAAINIIRRLLQDEGAEVVHLGHNRSVEDIVHAAVQEGVHGVAVSSYQGGHMEFFKYLVDRLCEENCGYVKVFGGGGGVIVPEEIEELEAYGVAKIYSPEDGRKLGLVGMIRHMMEVTSGVDFPDVAGQVSSLTPASHRLIGRLVGVAERSHNGWGGVFAPIRKQLEKQVKQTVPVVGITGTGGAGKSSFIDELLRRVIYYCPDKKVAVFAVDPSRRKSGGCLLGDRMRMNALVGDNIYMRSLATRKSAGELSAAIDDAIVVARAAGFDLVIIETCGIGQGDAAIADVCDLSVYLMTSDFGAPSQLEKIDMLDFADIIVINKFETERARDALRDVRKQYRRNHNDFDTPDEEIPVYGTVASRYDDAGMDNVFTAMLDTLKKQGRLDWEPPRIRREDQAAELPPIIPAGRAHYLREIAGTVQGYHRETEQHCEMIESLDALTRSKELLQDGQAATELSKKHDDIKKQLDPRVLSSLEEWDRLAEEYSGEEFSYTVRGKEIRVPLTRESLAGLKVPRVAVPSYKSRADLYRFLRGENLPGRFPFTAGVFPFRRDWEDPKRQFAGEGTPERTNKRFHYLCQGDESKRLSTAFDSVTLYGNDPDPRPDIFGKIGESGVSICTLDDMKKLYAGFDLCWPSTSVSMTINGPAPIMAAMFFNTAIDQQVAAHVAANGKEPSKAEREKIRARVFSEVRGTVQADILKEDQGQNTCIFGTEFALKMMGDMQQFFIENDVENFYSVSISGYHIAEAGANPVTQLAFTLANGFTYVEYYRSRGMDVKNFARNFSFFFSSGMDPEYSVIGRVARRIWAVAMKELYGAEEPGQRLKYHVQTSGRSLHNMEIQFNDIRTTLQALMALEDSCNSLHTNAYDEAITTPTEESVRRAMAIQMIINREFGLSKNENPLQGSFIIDWLTDAVEEAVLKEFERISDRGGVLGAMESHYQRSRIQDESLYYERLKHSGELPIIGVNTFVNTETSEADVPVVDLTRATPEEKQHQLDNLRAFQERNSDAAPQALARLKEVAISGGNIFRELVDSTVRVASLGEISRALYDVGGMYRRNM